VKKEEPQETPCYRDGTPLHHAIFSPQTGHRQVSGSKGRMGLKDRGRHGVDEKNERLSIGQRPEEKLLRSPRRSISEWREPRIRSSSSESHSLNRLTLPLALGKLSPLCHLGGRKINPTRGRTQQGNQTSERGRNHLEQHTDDLSQQSTSWPPKRNSTGASVGGRTLRKRGLKKEERKSITGDSFKAIFIAVREFPDLDAYFMRGLVLNGRGRTAESC